MLFWVIGFIIGGVQSLRSVAQPGRALRSGRRGRWFEPSHSDHRILATMGGFFIYLCEFSVKNDIIPTILGVTMTKEVEEFKQAIARIEADERYVSAQHEESYMSQMKNWCVVHATSYLPKTAPDGSLYIPSTAMATDFRIPRSTVHVTLNHIVTAHGYGSWDDAPIVILAPYNDVAGKNGNPAEVAGTDTYWSVNPDKGLVLPESAYVIQPDDNGPLFQIGEHGATYKRDNYTEEEVAQIESLLDWSDRDEYMKYKNGEIEDYVLEYEFRRDKRIQQMYESAKDKKAFLRGLFEESRFAILSKYLRDIVFKMAIKKIGYEYVGSILDGNDTSSKIARAAIEQGIPGNASNKGHSNSLYHELEECWGRIISVFEGNSIMGTCGIFNAKDMSELFDFFVREDDDPFVVAIIHNLVEDKPVDFVKVYQDTYVSTIERYKRYCQYDQDYYKREIGNIPNYNISDERKKELEQEYQGKIARRDEEIAKWSGMKTIVDYDKNLDETIRRHCERLSKEYESWRTELIKKPEFSDLKQRLKEFITPDEVIQMDGRDEY